METKKNKIHFLPSVIIFAVIVLLVWLLFSRASASMDTDGGQTLETALENSAVLCYSLEGFYPPTTAWWWIRITTLSTTMSLRPT